MHTFDIHTEPVVVGLPHGCSAWSISTEYAGVRLLGGWEIRDRNDQRLFFIGREVQQLELPELIKRCREHYLYEPPTDDPAGEPDLEDLADVDALLF
ncbi:hypothetical protein [Synechococcus elongatus]|uniref:Uncharacterized protein n=1 Tax=Synechococcus elongatus (strain ATCC 33912 / PCC 7942 / FACHB-805) TaxID=1140 RepID=Q31QB6_SYNE7|nr:hypothetical protein [Synechococcus elongatus]ABB56753.1 hypothetical protein Synpcc7942_0721 [Synechococcus elongatus PCC 7942 = FACHB-805]AJD58923.1 hypothetical protein M744_13150 [Synechococcus elongatus UTEX 2973]MBD2588615.1 hypothetical protein [Synechococcus elongatus FACHB-242]MBD2689796.1 hypothetical protein [Synechococcus elongatus FACHB-1061]MBD2708403.1 hypothetical protein [Synechococcus elongatus PCC 7942 = FACHB-805]